MSNVTWERRYEALKAIHDELAEDSLRKFFPTQQYGEVGKLVKYKGKLYALLMPYGQIWAFDGEDWELAYDVRQNGVRESDDFCFTAWGSHHWTRDNKLYFSGVFWKTGNAAIVRFDGATWEFFELTSFWNVELSRMAEFGDYLYVCSFSGSGKILRSSDGKNWTEVYDDPTPVGVRDLCTTGNPANTIWAVKGNGEILKSTDGTTWTMDYTDKDGTALWRLSTFDNGNKALAGGANGVLHLWSGAYGAWKKIGNLDSEFTITEIKNFGLGKALITCRMFPNEKAARTSLGALYLVTDDARIIPILYTFGYVLFGVEEFGGHLYVSFGWDDVIAKTQFKTHFQGVKRINMMKLAELIKAPALPKSEQFVYTNIDVASNATFETFNVGAYGRVKFKLKNTGSYKLYCQWFYSLDGFNFWGLEQKGITAGTTEVFDFSHENYVALQIKLWTDSGLPTNARLEVMLDNFTPILTEEPLTKAPEGKSVTKIEFGEDTNGDMREIKFYDGAELLFTLTFSNAGAVASTWNITRS